MSLGVCSAENARLALITDPPMPAAALMMASPTLDAQVRLSDLVKAMQEDPPEFSEFDLWSGLIPRLDRGAMGVGHAVFNPNSALRTWPARESPRLLPRPPMKRRK